MNRGIWGSYYNLPKAIFYLLKGDSIYIYMPSDSLDHPVHFDGPLQIVSPFATSNPLQTRGTHVKTKEATHGWGPNNCLDLLVLSRA